MLEATDYFQDWGPWGWIWAIGLSAFLLGLILAPFAWSGEASGALFFAALPGAVLMRAAAKVNSVRGSSGLETNI